MTEPRKLGGRYELGESIGSGGMAEVHLGRDTRLGRDVAIKVLRRELASDPTFIARFRREAQAAAQLNHPNIVSVYDTGDDKAGVPFIVMEYVEGQTLRDLLRSEGRIPPRRAMELTADICLALQYSHEAGIVHRDIKPGNVMLTKSGAVKVMDFGIARAMTSATVTQTAAVLGTAQYLSPEQARGEHVDARSDIYSTGCLLYELVSGRPPFSGDSPVAVAYQHVREEPPLPSQRNPELDSTMDSVVMKAMAKNPANRYQTADEMREDLLRAADGQPVLATPHADAEATSLLTPAANTMVLGQPLRPPPNRRGWAYGALAVACLLVFVLAALFVRSLVGDGGGPRVATPLLIGRTEAEARQLIEAAGLRPRKAGERFVHVGEQPAGRVIDQDPIQNISVKRDTEVSYTISLGVRRFALPSLIGQTEEQAKKVLSDNGLKGIRHERDANEAPGTVLDTDPKPGTEVQEGNTIHYVVASGKVTVPSVIGLDQTAATAELQKAGFKVVVTSRVDDTQPPNTVVDQSPGPDSKAERGSTVTIVVAQPSGQPTGDPTPTDEPTASETPTPSATPT